MKQKALIFIEDTSFTFDNRVKQMAASLVENGWSVTVISQKFHDDPFYRKISDNFRTYHFPKPTAEGALGHVIEHAYTLIAGTLLTLWVALRHGFSVFHACNPMDIMWMLAFPYRLFGKRFIFDQHDLCPELYLSRADTSESDAFYRALQWLERCSYRTAHAVISTNESYKAIAVSRGGRERDDVFVVRNGPNMDRLREVPPRTDLKAEGETLVGYLGNINPQDGVDLTMDAAQYIRGELGRTDIKFVLVGGGSSQPILAEQSREMGLGDVMTFTGRLSDEDMLATLSACEFCLQPDPKNPLNDKSTMNKVMEYMAIGKPVVAFDLVETRVSCGDAALYATPNEVADLAEKIVFLADHPEERERMAKLGKERVHGQLLWKYSVPHLLAAYKHATR